MATLQILPVSMGNNQTAQVIVLSPPRQPVKILPKQLQHSGQNGLSSGGAVLREHTKKRIHFSKKALTHPRPQSVVKRNTRERTRIKAVNQSFLTLANHVPETMRSKKMSKVDTLKAAITYINALQEALDSDKPLSIPDLSELDDLSPDSPSCSSVAASEVSASAQRSQGSPSTCQSQNSPTTPTTHHQTYYQPTSPLCQQLSYPQYEPISPAYSHQQSHHSPTYQSQPSPSSTYQTSPPVIHRPAPSYWPQYYTQQVDKYQQVPLSSQYSTSYSAHQIDFSGQQSDGWMSPTDSHYSYTSDTSSLCYQTEPTPSPNYQQQPDSNTFNLCENAKLLEFSNNAWLNF